MDKEWCLTSSTGVNPNPWGNTISDTITFNLNEWQFTCVNEITQILKLQVENRVTSTSIYNITAPTISWAKQINTTLQLYSAFTKNTFVLDINSQSYRGDVGFVQELESYSYGAWKDNALIEFLETPTPQTLAKFDAARKIKFDIDWAEKEDRLLPIKNIKLEYTWKSQPEIFQPPTATPTFTVKLLGIDYIYPRYTIKPAIAPTINPKRFQVPTTRIYTISDLILTGAQSYSKVVTVPGPPIIGTYFFLRATASTQDGLVQGEYTLNPNDSAIVSNVRLECGGYNFPITSAYNSVKTATDVVNWIRHYDDYQKLSYNWDNKTDSIQTAQTWLNDNRIYKVGFSKIGDSSAISVNLEFAAPTTKDCRIVLYFTYKDKSLIKQLEEHKMPAE